MFVKIYPHIFAFFFLKKLICISFQLLSYKNFYSNRSARLWGKLHHKRTLVHNFRSVFKQRLSNFIHSLGINV